MTKKSFRTLLQSGLIAAMASILTLALVKLPVSEFTTSPAQAAVDSRKVKPKTAVIEVVESASPAVVTVGAVKRQLVRQPYFDDFFLFPSYRVMERRSRVPYLGSGFLIDSEGHILTNHHVVEDSESLFVTFPDGREFPATLKERDLYVDVALLKIDVPADELPTPLSFADSASLMLGEEVVALGNPFGNMIEDSRPTVTRGVISAINRNFRPDVANRRVYQGMIQTDAAINPGNSGGPLVDINGEVVGMNTFIFSPSGGSAGIGFAIPASRLLSFYNEVKQHGRLRPLSLDMAYQAIRAPRFQGIQILSIQNGGAAEKSGLRVGDVILSADGRTVGSNQDFYLIFASKQVGDKVQLRVWRDGAEFATSYEIEEYRI